MDRAEQVEKTIRQIMSKVQDFTLNELLELRFDLEERIEQLREQSSADVSAPSEPTITVREEWRKCGKPSCRCQISGELHGPYIYEYWKAAGRTHSRYVGKAKK
jgi:hypothetical protein